MSAGDRPPDASTGELAVQLSSQVSRLVRDEMKLAQTELKETAKHAGIGVGLFSAAAVLALFGAATVVAAAVAALSLALPVWGSALIVAAVIFVGAGVAALAGRKEVQQVSPTPERAVESIKQDIQEVKEARHDND